MKEKYIDLMEKALSAYTDDHIKRYFDAVKETGLTEHGFPRLTANIGILIAHGRRRDLFPLFLEMMDFCCVMFLRPFVKAANEFSVREVICCIVELEAAGLVDTETIRRWKEQLAAIKPSECYNSYEKSLAGKTRNWAIFMALSELFRQNMGLCDAGDFIDVHLAHQMQWLDENGMYRDNKSETVHQPMVYDLVTRGLFVLLLRFGYRGRYYKEIDACLKKAGLLTLKMQSPTGELPFGGRSNQFLHNEAWFALVMEFEASRYAGEGDRKTAGKFKSAIKLAIDNCDAWLSKDPIRHIKNNFPTETKYGCEDYAYFDKYMITVASFLYAAYLVCDDSICAVNEKISTADCTVTTPYFHKLFLRGGDYFAELDLNADPHYDASGLGRVHKVNAPSALCLSVPCPHPAHSLYTVDQIDAMPLSLCTGIPDGNSLRFATDADAKYEILECTNTEADSQAVVRCHFDSGEDHVLRYTVSDRGIHIRASGKGTIAHALPAFDFDGSTHTVITHDTQSLSIVYQGWVCRYTTNGEIEDLDRIACNRNGHYRVFCATATDELTVCIELFPHKKTG